VPATGNQGSAPDWPQAVPFLLGKAKHENSTLKHLLIISLELENSGEVPCVVDTGSPITLLIDHWRPGWESVSEPGLFGASAVNGRSTCLPRRGSL
jgi:hypothetical protein